MNKINIFTILAFLPVILGNININSKCIELNEDQRSAQKLVNAIYEEAEKYRKAGNKVIMHPGISTFGILMMNPNKVRRVFDISVPVSGDFSCPAIGLGGQKHVSPKAAALTGKNMPPWLIQSLISEGVLTQAEIDQFYIYHKAEKERRQAWLLSQINLLKERISEDL